MSPIELRASGLVQGGLIATGLALFLPKLPPGSETATWPYVLGAYGFLAVVTPWFAGVLQSNEFSARFSAVAAMFLALPASCCGALLWPTAYRGIAIGAFTIVGLWLLHFLLVLAKPRFLRELP